ncbi:bifunctional tRNA (5-methylaminomethyl-2-thiouridine)(34)-methyltransferase MnmD/FAD-dependent 5-carboxymethylaminomethyl-2-thiouridine(34) oxidoreductase MnmC [Pseudocolwellia sp. HL-MZ19]|uniref:bifunctional tRNA (5-methylaminomethyl-2-thiouridine)(34)-methyltransferase MnmD/FAD-dependent 5-carboxymethylaminomethyl-2-thiouridine(34) oxidoreductase MnmC n=1 Tax=Pseudocolwellia sp. HL-MZ19 TaxID=3400846 RepID=UPI003CF10060
MNSKTSLIFQDNGAPYSKKFDDIYFDRKTGCEQSTTIFIEANEIVDRLKNNNSLFTIAETGFGTGLNFLLTLDAYKQANSGVQSEIDLPKNKEKTTEHQAKNSPVTKLHFISVEKYPLSKKDLAKSLQLFPHLAEFYQPLLEQYPENIDAIESNFLYFSFFDNKVSLTLYIGDATEVYTALKSPKEGLIDTWYLDGFSPNKNPEMWSLELFTQIARLAKEQSTLSTFTIAGHVRRQLIEVGFRLQKIETSGLKKEVLKAVYQQTKSIGKGYQTRPRINKPQHVAIIGGGIASACAAYYLTTQGVKVTLYCKDNSVAQGASSNAIGALFPLLHQQRDDISEFYEAAYWRALHLYHSLLEQGFNFSHQWCGLLEISYKAALEKRQTLFDEIKAWPENLIHSVNAKQAQEISNLPLQYGGLFMPEAGWIAPQELVHALLEAAKATNRLRIENSVKVESLTQNLDQSWQLNTTKNAIKKQLKEHIIIVCGGADSIHINTINDLPLTSVRGQITSMKSDAAIGKLSTVICHKGYLTPAHKNIHCIGATFDKNSFDITATPEGDEYNLGMLSQCLPELTNWTKTDVASAKARLRCMTPDHLPLVGAMPNIKEHVKTYAHLRKDKNWKFYQTTPTINNLYVLTGLGARGLCSAPLAAEILTADICGTPYPVNNKMLFNLSPNRFVIRDLIKRKI